MADLTTLDNVKQWLGLNSVTDDALLSRLITSVSDYIQAWLNRQIAVTAYTETRDGNGRDFMLTANFPLVSVTSVVVDGVIIPSSTAYNMPGYYLDSKMQSIRLRQQLFTKGRGNVSLSYTAGYAATPPELEQACIETIALRYRERDRIGHASKSLQGETVAFTIVDFPKPVMTILNNYKKVIPL